jgi:hypothetical protein
VPVRLWSGVRLEPLKHADADEVGQSGARARTMPRLALILPDAASIGHVARHPFALGLVREVRIEVARWRAPVRGWVGRLGPVRELRRSEVRVPMVGGRVRIAIELGHERPLREVLAAVEGLLLPGAPMPATHAASVGSQGRLPAWLPAAADVAARFALPPGAPHEPGVDPVTGTIRGPQDPPPNRPPVDAELVMDDVSIEGLGLVAAPHVRVTEAGVAWPAAMGNAVFVDVRGRHRPWLPPRATDPHVVIEVRGGLPSPSWRARVRIAPTTDQPHAGAPMGPWRNGAAAPPGPDPHGTVWSSAAWHIGPDAEPAAAASAIVNAALTGIVQDGRAIPAAVRACLAPELVAIMDEPLPSEDDPMTWERRSIRQRRAAVRGHATALAAGPAFRPVAAVPTSVPSVTALLVTRRPALVAEALRSMELQTYPQLEVVLVLHGAAARPSLRRRVAGSPLPVELVVVPAVATLGEALGVATARARGSLITKVDDDDVYGPEHIWDLIVGRAVSGATVVGKPAQFVLLEQRGVTVRRDRPSADVFGRVVAGGTILMSRGDLEAMGGWRPVPSGVDRALLDRVLHAGGTIYQTWPFGFIYRRHGMAHTWDVADDYFLRGVTQTWQGIPDLPEFGVAHAHTSLTIGIRHVEPRAASSGDGRSQPWDRWVQHRGAGTAHPR